MAKTYNDIYMDARNRFRQAGISEYSLEARLLLAHIAGKSPADFYKDIRLYTSRQFEVEAETTICRRIKGEPVAQLTGSWEFYGMSLNITKDVLIPRTDTEVIAKTAIELIRDKGPCRILDLCCGSGCIGLAIAENTTDTRLVLADISDAALKVAKSNCILNKLASRTSCIKSDALDNPSRLLGTFELIVSNPPYIKTGDIASLDVSVRDYEPLGALDGGEDGLIFYRSICSKWTKLLNESGHLILECGINQSEDVKRIGEQAGLKHIKSIKDTLNIERAVVFQK